MNNIVLISKDVLRKDYLPVYGNRYWKTPNIDALAKQGTVFHRHYTAAPSTAMAFTSMFTGMYAHQTGRKDYTEVAETDKASNAESLFDFLDGHGYKCHLLWSQNYIHMAERFSKCFGKNTVHHDKLDLNQFVGAHIKGLTGSVTCDDSIVEENYGKLMEEINSIDTSSPVFLWVHLPHVLKGRECYGGDIDLLDRFVGDIRNKFGDQITITADHGSGNGKDGITGYGFHLYESQICIPLITPKIQNVSEIHFPTSNTQLTEILFSHSVSQKDYVISDTAYYQQPHRKLAIVQGNYKYIYEKQTKTEHLYDVVNDPEENLDLHKTVMHDKERNRNVVTRQVLFYHDWDKAEEEFVKLRAIKDSIWKDGTLWERIKYGSWRMVIYNFRRKIKSIQHAFK